MWSNSRYFWMRDNHIERAAGLISGSHGDEFHENALLYRLAAWFLLIDCCFKLKKGKSWEENWWLTNAHRCFTFSEHDGSEEVEPSSVFKQAYPEQLPVSASRHSWKYHFLKHAHKPQNLFKTQACVNSSPRCYSSSLRYSYVITSRTEVTPDMKLKPLVLLDIWTESQLKPI